MLHVPSRYLLYRFLRLPLVSEWLYHAITGILLLHTLSTGNIRQRSPKRMFDMRSWVIFEWSIRLSTMSARSNLQPRFWWLHDVPSWIYPKSS